MLATRARAVNAGSRMPIPPSPAVLRACDVLDHLAAHPSEAFTVSELARSVGLARASCDSVLLALAERGLVHRGRDRRYSLGAACRALGDAAGAAGAPLAVLEPIADGLARATRSCVAISSASHGETRVEQVFDHGPAFGLRARVGESVPLVPPFGAVFVAWQGDAAIEAWLDRAGHGLGDRERSHLRAALAAARARGYCISVAGVRPELVQMLEELAGEVPDARRRDARDAPGRRPAAAAADVGARVRRHRPRRVRVHGARAQLRRHRRRDRRAGCPAPRRGARRDRRARWAVSVNATPAKPLPVPLGALVGNR